MSIFDRIRRIKEKNNTWQKAIGRFLCSMVLIGNFILLVLWYAPDHIRHPISQQIHNALPSKVQEHVAARAGVSIHSKFNKDGTSTADDEANMIAQQNEDRDNLFMNSGACDADVLLLNSQKSNNNTSNNNDTGFFTSTFSDDDDVETRLSQHGFKNLLQTCTNFEDLRENKKLVIGRIITPGLFRCQFLLWSDQQKQQNRERNQKKQQGDEADHIDTNSSLLDHHGDCWCSKKFLQSHQHASKYLSSSSLHQSIRELKRFLSAHNAFLSLNNTVTIHAEKMTRVNVPPYCAEAELTRILIRHNSNNNNNSNSSSIIDNSTSSGVAVAPGSPLGGNAAATSGSATIPTITNATLRDVLRQVTKVQIRLRKSGLHINKNTQVMSMAKSQNSKDLTIAEAFIHIVASQLHHNFEGKKCLVWSSRKLPTVEVTMYALSGARHVDAVATQAYKTTVPAMTVYTPPEFVAKLTEFELKRQQKQKPSTSSSSSSSYYYAYGAIVSYMTLQELGLGRFGETIDPFADFHAMNEFWHLLQPGGTLVLVIPVGADCIDFNNRRVYGRTRLAVLLRGWTVDFSVGIGDKTLRPSAANVPCDANAVSDALIVLRRSNVNWNDKESVEADGIGRIPGLL